MYKEIISVSKSNKKMGAVPSFSTPAGAAGGCVNADTTACDPNPEIRLNPDGTVCYANKAYVQYPQTRKAYDRNLRVAQSVPVLERQLTGWLIMNAPSKFRWHVSGDILNLEYLEMMIRLAEAFPETQFLCYTKAIRILVSGGAKIAAKVLACENLHVYVSSMTEAQREYIENHDVLRHYPIAHCAEEAPKGFITCPEQTTKGKVKCETCRVCYTGKPVNFLPH